ncbi:MAG: thiamine-monophosphate kinase [Phycisphaerales bacterium]|nr:thiamine-monophosphate kinase [Phycisphaerales bacterium]
MSVSEDLIIRLAQRLGASLPPRVTLGPGDDMALLSLPGNQLLIAADQIVAGVHYSLETPLPLVARKAVARNVSDAAAMAGIPLATLACAVLPTSMTQAEAELLLVSLADIAQSFDCPLIGGDTTIHTDPAAPLTLSVTIVAAARSDGIVVRRDGARRGDSIVISGAVGGSFGADGLGRHLSFTPRVVEAQELVDALGRSVHAMIDLSDGLGVDLVRVIDASSRASGELLEARLNSEAIPLNAGCVLPGSLSHGEDYELVAMIAPGCEAPAGWTRIGVIQTREAESAPRVVLISPDGAIDISSRGWIHGTD